MEDIIQIERLTKQYGKVTAVNGLNLTVRSGEIYGLLGPNGAGKTTTIRIMTTLTKQTSGRVRVGGFDVLEEADNVKELIGVVQQHTSLDRDLTVRENMELHGRLHRIPAAERKKRIDELLDYAGLTEQSDKMVETLSGGMKKKLTIVCCLIHRPRVLFLDEPTVGLDAQYRRKLWDLVRSLNKEGTTILLTTHYIEEAEALCQRVGIVDHGRIIAQGSPIDLRKRLGMTAVEMLYESKETRYQYFSDRVEAVNYLKDVGAADKTVIIRDSNLEDVFVELTGQKVGDA
ncbi:MAG: ABC transporter ATP-binding protein [Methanomassiliicoccus sp.]|nr:ABC transporter ATP-binding protein [Methanomassiliicoccus sp.]